MHKCSFGWNFWKHTKICYWLSKMPFWRFLAVNKYFLWDFKNTDQNFICASIILKAKTEKNEEQKLVEPRKITFLSLKKTFKIFFSYFSFETIDAQMLFWSVFVKTLPKTAKMAFLIVNNFFFAFSKISTKRTFVLVFKTESKPKHKKNFWGAFLQKQKKTFGGLFFKNQKPAFSGVQNCSFFKFKFRIWFSAFLF